MSRLSLRLDDGLLDRGLPHSSASFSVGGGSWRSSRSLKCRRSQQLSAACSESLLGNTPRRPSVRSLHSVASDASLLSSLLDDSSVHENTLVDTLWGLDDDVDPKESTVIMDQSSVLVNSTLIGLDGCCDKHLLLSDRKESIITHCSSSKYSSASCSTPSLTGPGPSNHGAAETSVVYCRDRSRRRTTTTTTTTTTARSGHCGVMDLKDSTTSLKELDPNRPLSRSVGEVFGWLNRRRHMTGPDYAFLLTWFPVRRRLVLMLLLLLLLLLSPCWLGPAGLQSVLAALHLTEWRTPVSHVPGLVSSQGQSAEGAVEETLYGRAPPADEEESERLTGLERSLATLWERVEAGGRRAEQRHVEVLQLYADLQQPQSAGDHLETWVSRLLDGQLTQLRTCLDEERQQREQIQQQVELQQESQASRLDQLQLQLQTLVTKTEEEQRRRDAATTTSAPPAVSVGVDRRSHDALLAEVATLEAALEDVRQDVQGLSWVKDACRRLDEIQQTISAQIREEVRALVFGNQPAVGGGADLDALPESLLQWLSQQYVGGADLQEALASLELSILQNLSLQLERHGSEQMVQDGIVQTAGAAGAAVTQEDVRVIVTDALRLFSQDRTGRADYALESGGGSVLSTRCSETYETKAALLSLFGLPLWYFSQSPRAVIQPDVHPGSCWAFRGSTGFLVIRLSMRILPSAFSLEHLPRALAPSGALHSAPRDFAVYGLDDERQDRGKLLGSYTFDQDGDSLQTFAATKENDETFQVIEVQVLSNWGHQEYTCMYRFRVHGTPRHV
ncbi:putative SUN domain-containing protein 1-like [Scophthalmus maximus]|uniref:Putative SUN domain-containing protein 1-like n=1 Tax=Scophthalmus maximus TaxID=52904 RepID=A0A2U9CQJ9_SCOMX|nr:putative SUN domain-containing protein 1-like [Scophthalmus maximus]